MRSWETAVMDRRRLFPLTVGGALGMSVAASVAAGYQSSPTTWQMCFLVVATLAAMGAEVATAPNPFKKLSKKT
jgi:hypothetical protein